MIIDNYIITEEDIIFDGIMGDFKTEITTKLKDSETSIFNINISAETPVLPQPITIKWKIPAHNIKGVWKPTTDFAKRIQADWEMDHMESRISIDAPVISLFGHDDNNAITFACSNAINKLELNARIREENDFFFCHVTLFLEQQSKIDNYNIQLRIDQEKKHFSEALKAVSQWWEGFDNLKPASVPDIALTPLYSTWYNFHQNLDENILIKECEIAYNLGYKSVIIDDGWQTNDDNRGYDYTGDWHPERISKTKEFVNAIHNTGMKIGFWYSVPFCGKKSEAYKHFKGKFLTEDHRWAPVFDPRYPEVREYLINIYKNALLDWNLDGFKLDFIDDFRLYNDTPSVNSHMDYGSINAAVDRLLTDVKTTLTELNPDIFIEFRQKYVGPAMRKYGNMFRAFDCPGDATMNRTRIADIRMLAGNTAVHSDMITWHNDEQLEVAALQMVNTLFGVPQISVILDEIPKEHLEMVKFYTNYWNKNKDIITTGHFTPHKPLANYPIQTVIKNNLAIIGLHDDHAVQLDDSIESIDIINAKLSTSVIVKTTSNLGNYNCRIFNCKGDIVNDESLTLYQGLAELNVPACGLVQLTLKK
ncbi:glycoside hydrolase family 36 protein [uncultured Algibacter sp.]|uniref:glycoside hydrolase family 36 protein n=1 Tax=uncultured Algibacter sp. TaxID=298659 RepID=UPI0026072C96|nr:glycoside hydrolase family 36 protein [uncultured Algibacter sp.]